ncbi:SurA N-terminal domain-containing protein [Streptomyces sp. H10-C2]|uniref:SurA N-terminal domain-containing protein n=1 Tax=unclassified Streptomyces TaxID=2593676 RepID=UPI0024B92553|nr:MULTISPECIES: SurA N-terminal domain-containing protein [unclassified Streptomyces]MDJ0341323.1 SurA N-terminal domain-containing protein [Streptomyces sp. PH10-H1]MDJ0370918.1 SurA N-terminal domain-containing protein [Streptomyces sp. H10-C2]
MVRRRTAVSLAAAALVAMTPVLSACGTPRAGAAAVVGNETISVSALQSKVNAVRTAQEKLPQSATLIENSSQLTSETLGNMVFERVLKKAAHDAGVTVSPAEVQKQRTAIEQRQGGADAVKAQVVQSQHPFAPADIDTVIGEQIAQTKLMTGLGFQPGSDGGITALQALLVKTSKSMGIDVSPRYGTWNAESGKLLALQEPWLVKAPQALPGA